MEVVTKFVDVIVPLSVPNKYTYRVPTVFQDKVEIGKRVLVQFGKRRIYTGIINRIHETAPVAYQAKYIDSVLDDLPVVNSKQLKFWDWLAFYYCANIGDVMNAALPSGLKLSSNSHVVINTEFNFDEMPYDFLGITEHVIVDALNQNGGIAIEELGKKLDNPSIQKDINKLIKKGVVEIYEEVKDKYKPKTVHYIKLDKNYHSETSFRSILEELEKRAFKQVEVLLAYKTLSKEQTGEQFSRVKKTHLVSRSSQQAVGALVKKGVLLEEITVEGRLSIHSDAEYQKVLTEAQTTAFKEIKKGFSETKTVLLQGVTGSGKTEIYIQLINEALATGKQVLYLLPEIALTTQLIERLKIAFGNKVGVYHSRFSENERVEIWTNVLNFNPGETGNSHQVILAARSGIFLPFTNLGLIIVDEEHDFSFKQNSPAPRYHSRDAALYLATLYGSDVLLGSATPSLETLYNVNQGKYYGVKLYDKFIDTGETEVIICNIRKNEDENTMQGILTRELYSAVNKALEENHQTILFQNRRGFAPYTQCHKCGHVIFCENCDVPLIYHKSSNLLSCHYCGHHVAPSKSCPACGSVDLRLKGLGTERIEEDLSILFPEARISRMDLDSTRSKYAYKKILDEFENGEIDILIGTQMVTKGLDFANVKVVGMINVDSLLNFPDFRSYERAYQLITQLKGRAGRKNTKGEIYIQTNQPEHKVLEFIQRVDQDGFYEMQLQERKNFHYPPYTRLFEINVLSKNRDEVNFLSEQLITILKPFFQNEILGPEFSLIPKVRNFFHKKILIKQSKEINSKWVREALNNALINLHVENRNLKFLIQIDVDPY